MAFKPGHGAHILMDSVAGTPVNVTAYADNFSFPVPTDSLDVSVFGTSSKQFIPGLTGGGQPSLSGPLDVALGTFVAAIINAQAAGSTASYTVTYSPGGSVAGQIKQSAEVFITNYTPSTAVGGRAEYSCTLQGTGATTFTTW